MDLSHQYTLKCWVLLSGIPSKHPEFDWSSIEVTGVWHSPSMGGKPMDSEVLPQQNHRFACWKVLDFPYLPQFGSKSCRKPQQKLYGFLWFSFQYSHWIPWLSPNYPTIPYYSPIYLTWMSHMLSHRKFASCWFTYPIEIVQDTMDPRIHL